MAGIHRERPGAADLAAATDTPATPLGNHIWMSPGVSNSYAVATDDGRVIVNAGLVFEGPLHRKAFAEVAGPTRAIVVTQGHADHWGGVNSLRDADTEIVMHAQLPLLARRQRASHGLSRAQDVVCLPEVLRRGDGAFQDHRSRHDRLLVSRADHDVRPPPCTDGRRPRLRADLDTGGRDHRRAGGMAAARTESCSPATCSGRCSGTFRTS